MELASPSTLNSRITFAQAKALLSQTSRASNHDWYKDGLDLAHQWHLVILGGNRIYSALLKIESGEATWLSGPGVNLTLPPTLEQVDALLEDIFSKPDFSRAKSLGVVIHLGDELATTEILTEVRTANALNELKVEVISSPSTVLGDPSLSNDTTSTRLIPYAGAQAPPLASTVTLSKTHEYFVDCLRSCGESRNLPIQVFTVSAPLAFISILPAFLQFREGHPQFILLHYPKFSCLAVFNTESNLVQLRSLPHRGRPFPANLGDAVNTALDSLELTSPIITILPMGDTDPSPLLTQLHATLNQPDQAEVHILRPSVESLSPGVPELRPEMLISIPSFASTDISPGFRQLYQERWALQDFLPIRPEIAEIYPNAAEMRLLSIGRILAIVLAIVILLLLGLAIKSIIGTMQDPSWNHDPAATVIAKSRQTKAQTEVTEFEHWNILLQERSKAWMSMELLTQLFPEKSGVLVTSFKNSNRLDTVIKNNKVGFIREWNIEGLALNDAVELLNTLNGREGIGAVFKRLHEKTENNSFNMAVTGRSLVVSLERSRNSTYARLPGLAANDPKRFPFIFSLKITQTFGPEDPMAIKTKSLSAK